MAFNLQPIHEIVATRGVKIVVHGPPGVGKTVLSTTFAEPSRTGVICAEGGLLSIKDYAQQHSMVGGEIRSFADFESSFSFFAYDFGALEWFRNIVLDSISEIAEVCLQEEIRVKKDPRQAYGEMANKMKTMIRAFRDLHGYNVVFTAQQEREKTDEGTKFFPSFPGQQLAGAKNWMSHQFDEVFSYRIVTDAEGKPRRLLQTQPDQAYDAKDRSGKLDFWEEPNLQNVINKIMQPVPNGQ